jgi:hypothetical protein
MRKILLLTGLVFLVSLMAANAGSPGNPAPIQRTSCTASLDCICGGGTVNISCTGDVSCHVGPRYVECDGVSEHCPPIGSCPH